MPEVWESAGEEVLLFMNKDNMKKYLILLLAFLFSSFASASAQNISAIGQWVQSSPDEYYSLLARFENGDKDIIKSDLAKLYYGFAFCKEYNGNFDMFSEMYDALKAGDNDKALEEAMKSRKQNPVCLELLYQIASLTFKSPEGVDNAYRVSAMMKVILDSGDGKSPQSAYKVIRTGDEYKILSIVYRMDSLLMQTALDGNIDKMDIATRDGKEVTVYFDRSLPSARDAEILSGFVK